MDKKELAFESALYRMDMMNKRLWLLCIALMLLLLSSNLGWLYYELQYQTETTQTIEQEMQADDVENAVMNGTGEVNINGQDETNDKNND